MTPQCQLTVRPPVVIVIDDDPAVCNSLKFSLELEGFAVLAYDDGIELLGSGDIYDCDCFVVDQRMPRINGMELIAALRQRNISTPAILIISHPTAAVVARAALADIPIVEKPLFSNALIERIREACRRG